MRHELDLYGSGINWRKVAAIGAALAVIVSITGFFGYRWLTTVTPVTQDQALELYKAEARSSDQGGGGESATKPGGDRDPVKDAAKKVPASKDAPGPGSKPPPGPGPAAAGSTAAQPASSGTGGRSSSKPKAATDYERATPEEGVYSWATDGWEEAAGIRREFPDESQRIITASNGSGWKQHHFFSEEREIWSSFVISQQGAHMAMQRNRAKFGPVTNDSTIDFAPPMLVAPADLKVGYTWNGRWEGKTSGSYTGQIFDHGVMEIGGQKVEVWGMRLNIQLRGELDGTVLAEVMLAPKYALTVKEHYTQDLQSDKGRYRAEWTMTLKSLNPRR